MTRILLEIVPRKEEQIKKELRYIKENFPQINAVNIPDLLKYDIRSWEGAAIAKSYFEHTLPHIRAIDFNLNEKIDLTDYLIKHSINEVLVIKGDLPHIMTKPTYPTSSLKLIKYLKKEIPALKVYAAIDPYRNGIKNEFNYIEEKLDAGADGFLTQPFYDMRLIEIYAEKINQYQVYWGVSPVTSKESQNYWESKNMAYFPNNFEPTLEWNWNFAKQVIEFSKKNNFNCYLMPIMLKAEKYLPGIFN